jgi:hypothetical protein
MRSLSARRSIGIDSLLAPALILPMNSVGRVVAMRSGTAEPHPRWNFPDILSNPGAETTDDRAVGVAHLIADAMMSIAGPLFWAALALGFMTDVLGIDLFR